MSADDSTNGASQQDAYDDPAEAWDANDPRRRNDPFAPPTEPCECYCLHCQRTFMSDEIWLQRYHDKPPGAEGYDGHWLCPTPNCGGVGFLFDIQPTDPDHPANAGWCDDDYDDDEEFDEDEFDEADVESDEYDPDETKWKSLDAHLGVADDEDDDIEGEEWKHGLAPGEAPARPSDSSAGQREWLEEQQRYEMPDERPRTVSWEEEQREQSKWMPKGDDEIPF